LAEAAGSTATTDPTPPEPNLEARDWRPRPHFVLRRKWTQFALDRYSCASGPSSIAVWIFAWAGFFLPLAACVMELSSRYPQEADFTSGRRKGWEISPGFIAGGPTP